MDRLPRKFGARIAAPASSLAIALLLGACLGPDVEPAADVELGTTRALIQIDSVATGEAPQATAMAGFARIPSASDAEVVLDLVGWQLDLPPVGTCAPVDANEGTPAADSVIDHVEFLEVGDVVIEAGSSKTTLAPRAFPTVSDLISGVIYTTRDASEDPLPPGVTYQIHATGGIVLPPIQVSGTAPAPLAGLQLGGLAIEQIAAVPRGAPLEFSWERGTPGDLVALELGIDDGAAIACTFSDESGRGTVPAGALTGSGSGWLSAHRIRIVAIETPEIDRGELRFDLEQEVDVTYSR